MAVELILKALTHNSKLADSEPAWSSVVKGRLPLKAFVWTEAGTDKEKKSTWKYPHHHVVNGGELNDMGVYSSGDLYLHKGGLVAAWAAANGARSGQQASQTVKTHLNSHRDAIGLNKEDIAYLSIIEKAEEKEQQIVYAEVYVPLRIDTDHETMTPEDVEKAAHEFLASGKINKIDVQHDLIESGCLVVESFIARKGWEPFVEGAWVMGVKCTDEIWKLVKAGELNGFSFYGTSKKVPARVLVEVAKQIAGITELNTEDILPPHEHTFIINVNNDGQIVSGKTDVVYSHSHPITKGTATDEELDHRHRLVLE